MSNEYREQQMMNAADRYADEVCDESCTGAQEAETLNNFCAGWRVADSCNQWLDKVCEWLRNNLEYYLGDYNLAEDELEDNQVHYAAMIEELRKAMQ